MGKKCFKQTISRDIISSNDSLEAIISRANEQKAIQMRSYSNKPVNNFNTRYSMNEGSIKSFNENLNTYSTKDSNQNFPTINESPTYRILNENPLARSLDVDRLGAIDKKFKLNVALRKSNQRLLK